VEKKVFAERFHVAATTALDFARNFILEPLPDAKVFRVRLNCSYDKNLRSDEEVYPEDGSMERAHQLRQCTEAEVVEVLWRKGSVPEWVDLTVVGVTGTQTVVKLECCGRFTLAETLLYHQRLGNPPFLIAGPTLPVGYKHGDHFSIWRDAELQSQEELKQIQSHLQKVWRLRLLGSEFDDSTLISLPVFPSMEILALDHSPTRGEGLQSQSKHPKLRELSVGLAHPEGFRLSNVPTFPALETLWVHGLPSRPCGLEELLCRLPQLESLTLESDGNIFLDAPISKASRYLGITANNVLGEVRLPRELRFLSLHLRESSVVDVERLLRTVEKVRDLSLRGTPVDDRFAEEIVSRFPLEYVDLVETKVSDDALRRLAKAHPSLRIDPKLDWEMATAAGRSTGLPVDW